MKLVTRKHKIRRRIKENKCKITNHIYKSAFSTLQKITKFDAYMKTKSSTLYQVR